MGLFPTFERLGSQKEPSKFDQIIEGSLFHSIEYEVSGILRKIQNVNNINNDKIKDIIIRQHGMILNYDLFLESAEMRKQAQILFTNKKFLECFLDVIGKIRLSYHEKICLNKLAYDYYIYYDKNEEISDLLFQLTTWVNTKEVAVLSPIYGMNGARTLGMICNSSFKTEKNVHRVNTFIVKCNVHLTVQNIIDTYLGVFDRFSPVFLYTMMESKPEGLTQDESNRFDAISIAIIEILDSLPSNDIESVIQDYAFTLSVLRINTKVRFAMKSLSAYPRILQIAKSIEFNSGVHIP